MSLEIPEHWKRICGLHVDEDGTVGCVWMALDSTTSVVTLYDCAKFDREVLAVIGQGISGRGKWIPLAFRKEDEPFAKDLRDNYGVNVLPDPCEDSQAMAEVLSRTIWQKLRSSQLRVERVAAEWLEERRKFNRDNQKIPLVGYPLMAATRHAIEMISFARPQSMPGSQRKNHPGIRVY